ncbi:Helicase loader DnaI [uncultured Gammaproteobacteria bacterium]|nr:Helicase loader DnaI [uncultured Gammaproteobacteria bacterium]
MFNKVCEAIVTDYRLNANHNLIYHKPFSFYIVTDYRLNANHNSGLQDNGTATIVTDYRLNANHNFFLLFFLLILL